MMSYLKLDSTILQNPKNIRNNNDIRHLISSQPNSTILASNFPEHFSESDLFSLFSHYGHVQKVQKLLNINCCLIEFSDITIAKALVQMSKCNKFILGSYQVYLEYSLKKICSTNTSGNVIIIIISNVKYPITVDIIKQICQKFGKIMRIHIGKKNSNNVIESLVEFEQSSEAKAAKEGLNGEDIYSGCCSLEIKFSTVSCLTVLKNDDKSWDFTIIQSKQGILEPPLQTFISAPPIKPETNFTPNFLPAWPITNVPPPILPPFNPPVSQVPLYPFPPFDPSVTFPYHNPTSKVKLDISSDAFTLEKGTVFMCYNVPFNMSVDHLFNLFCLYGNVSKIRFLLNHLHAVMVQMGSKKAADLCIKHFNGKTLFGKEIKLSPCAKLEVFVPKKIEFLQNGTPCFKDFSKDPNNRFLNDLAVSTNKIYDPNRTLHFFNAPCTFREFDLTNMLLQSGVPKPLNIIIFNTKSDKIKKCIGLFEFHRIDDALVALSVLNHKPIIIPDMNQMFHLKLTFSAREPNKIGFNKEHLKREYSFNDDIEDCNWQNKMVKFNDKEYKADRTGFIVSEGESEDCEDKLLTCEGGRSNVNNESSFRREIYDNCGNEFLRETNLCILESIKVNDTTEKTTNIANKSEIGFDSSNVILENDLIERALICEDNLRIVQLNKGSEIENTELGSKILGLKSEHFAEPLDSLEGSSGDTKESSYNEHSYQSENITEKLSELKGKFKLDISSIDGDTKQEFIILNPESNIKFELTVKVDESNFDVGESSASSLKSNEISRQSESSRENIVCYSNNNDNNFITENCKSPDDDIQGILPTSVNENDNVYVIVAQSQIKLTENKRINDQVSDSCSDL